MCTHSECIRVHALLTVGDVDAYPLIFLFECTTTVPPFLLVPSVIGETSSANVKHMLDLAIDDHACRLRAAHDAPQQCNRVVGVQPVVSVASTSSSTNIVSPTVLGVAPPLTNVAHPTVVSVAPPAADVGRPCVCFHVALWTCFFSLRLLPPMLRRVRPRPIVENTS
jgi:hypothetical protein